MNIRTLTVFAWLLMVLCGVPGAAQSIATVEKKMTELAAEFQTDTLREMFDAYHAKVQPAVRFYCAYALAVADDDDDAALLALDSLIGSYSDKLTSQSNRHLIAQKARLLYKMAMYDELAAFCKSKIRSLGRSRLNASLVEELRSYAARGARFADTTSVRGRLISLAYKGDALRLRDFYEERGAEADGFARALCSYVLARDLYRDDLARYGEELLSDFADSLDASDRSSIAFALAAEYLYRGDYDALRGMAERFASDEAQGDERFRFRRYERIGRLMSGFGRVETIIDPLGAEVDVTPDRPIMLSASINGRPTSRFLLDTGSPLTVLGADEARRAGVRTIADTVRISTMHGVCTVHIGVADSLRLGGVLFRNLPVGVIAGMAHPARAGYENLIGIGELRRMGRVMYAGDKIKVLPIGEGRGDAKPNLTHTRSGGIRVLTDAAGRRVYFAFDTGAMDDYLSAEVFGEAHDVRIAVGGASYRPAHAQTSEGRAANHSGILGIPFALSADSICIDFHRARIDAWGFSLYTYINAFDQLASDDHFALSRRREALAYSTPAEYLDIMRLVEYQGLNKPDSVIALSSAIQLEGSDHYYVVMARTAALMKLGRYADAAAYASQRLADGRIPHEHRESLAQELSLARSLSSMPPPHATATSAATLAQCTITPDGAVSAIATVKGKKQPIAIDLTGAHTHISEKLAKKLGIQTFATDYKRGGMAVRIGVMPAVEIAGIVLHNLPCVVLPGKTVGITIGTDALRLAPGFTLTPSLVALTPRPQTEGMLPFRIYGGEPLFQKAPVSKPSDPTPTMTAADVMEAVKAGRTLSMDFEKMMYRLE